MGKTFARVTYWMYIGETIENRADFAILDTEALTLEFNGSVAGQGIAIYPIWPEYGDTDEAKKDHQTFVAYSELNMKVINQFLDVVLDCVRLIQISEEIRPGCTVAVNGKYIEDDGEDIEGKYKLIRFNPNYTAIVADKFGNQYTVIDRSKITRVDTKVDYSEIPYPDFVRSYARLFMSADRPLIRANLRDTIAGNQIMFLEFIDLIRTYPDDLSKLRSHTTSTGSRIGYNFDANLTTVSKASGIPAYEVVAAIFQQWHDNGFYIV